MDTSDFSISDKEIFCSLTFPLNSKMHALQQKIAAELSEVFAQGSATVARDPGKALQYKAQAHIPIGPQPKFALKTKYIYETEGWFHAIRLTPVRFNRVMASIRSAFLPWWYSYFGLLYAIELPIELGIVCHNIFQKRTAQEEGLPRLTLIKRRAYNSLIKEGRLSRIANAAVWFSINLTSLLITGGTWFVALNIIGSTFDFLHECYKGFKEFYQTQRLINKIDTQLQTEKIRFNDLQFTEALGDDVYHLKQSTQQQIKDLELVKTELAMRRKKIIKERALLILAGSLVVTGMFLFFFPPTSIAGASIIGATLAFSGGFIGGLGRRIYKTVSGFISSRTKEPEPVTTPLQNNVETQPLTNTYHQQLLPLLMSPLNNGNHTPEKTKSTPIEIIYPAKYINKHPSRHKNIFNTTNHVSLKKNVNVEIKNQSTPELILSK